MTVPEIVKVLQKAKDEMVDVLSPSKYLVAAREGLEAAITDLEVRGLYIPPSSPAENEPTKEQALDTLTIVQDDNIKLRAALEQCIHAIGVVTSTLPALSKVHVIMDASKAAKGALGYPAPEEPTPAPVPSTPEVAPALVKLLPPSNLVHKKVSPEFHVKFQEWLGKCRDMVETDLKENYPTLPPVYLEVDPGNRYIRIWKTEGSSRAAFAFVDTTSGDILKPATWKAPAKHARGNIMDSHGGMSLMTPHGPMYLK